MSLPIQDLWVAFQTLAGSSTGTPALPLLDGEVPDGTVMPYALGYFYIVTPTGLAAPDAVPLTMDSDVIDAVVYVHCVGSTPASARGVSGRIRGVVLNQVLTVTDRTCFPIRQVDGQPPRRDEEIPGTPVFDLVDVYGWRSVPA